jgi:hypothetical protein
MAYVVPDSSDFKARFPAFASYDDTYIDLVIEEAALSVNETWIETDYQPAILYLTAHLITTEAGGPGGVAGQSGPVQSESFGPISKSYAVAKGASGNVSLYSSTEYGRRYLTLLKRNFPAVAVI